MNIEGKIWGSTSEIFNKNNVRINRAIIERGYKCSEHCHPNSYNMFFVESGLIEVHRKKEDYDLVDVTLLDGCQSCIVPPGEYHHFIGLAQTSVVYEIYWVELTNDINRIDCGGPVCNKER